MHGMFKLVLIFPLNPQALKVYLKASFEIKKHVKKIGEESGDPS